MICDPKNISFHEILLFEGKCFIPNWKYHTYREDP